MENELMLVFTMKHLGRWFLCFVTSSVLSQSQARHQYLICIVDINCFGWII